MVSIKGLGKAVISNKFAFSMKTSLLSSVVPEHMILKSAIDDHGPV